MLLDAQTVSQYISAHTFLWKMCAHIHLGDEFLHEVVMLLGQMCACTYGEKLCGSTQLSSLAWKVEFFGVLAEVSCQASGVS